MDVKPFKALRPRKDLYRSIASLPYDVPTIEEVKHEISKQPLSFLRIVRAEGDFNEYIDPHLEKVYERAKFNFNHLRAKRYFIQDEKLCFYIYKIKDGGFQQTGFIGLASVKEYEKGIIKKHENTRVEKENDRIKHIQTINAQTGSVFLMYRSYKELNEILGSVEKTQPEIIFKSDDGIEHTLWVVQDDELIKEIQENFNNIDSLYISDGHHRAAAASSVSRLRNSENINKDGERKESDYFMSIIYPEDTLRILPYNRAVKIIKKISKDDFLTKIKLSFIVGRVKANDGENGFTPKSQRKIGMYYDGQWYQLEAKDHIVKTYDPVASLDVSLLQDNILHPLLDVEDPRTDCKIEFIDGKRGSGRLKELVDSGRFNIAFSMYPPAIEQLMAVADAKKLMPPKSTWFDPKPRSGMTIHVLD